MKQIVCDRCGKVINYSQALPVFAITRTKTSDYMDMCNKCRKDFEIFMHGGKVFEADRPILTEEQIEKITHLLEIEWGYEGIKEDVSMILREVHDE